MVKLACLKVFVDTVKLACFKVFVDTFMIFCKFIKDILNVLMKKFGTGKNHF